ncbi:hypothetical protein ABK040_000304 [Willaertia magna]
MEIIELKSQLNYSKKSSPLLDFKFNENIKFIKQGLHFILFITITNKIIIYRPHCIKKQQITFCNYPSNKNILFIESCPSYIILVNEENEFYINRDAQFYLRNDSLTFEKLNDLKIKDNIKFIRASEDVFVIVTKNNLIYNYGTKPFVNYNNNQPSELKLYTIPNENNLQIKDLQCGNCHIILLNKNGELYGLGDNQYGQLGLDDIEKVYYFTKINLDFKVKKIICNNDNTLLINEFNELYVCGINFNNQLGLCEKIIKTFTNIVIYDNYFRLVKVENCFKTLFNFSLISDVNNDFYICGKKENIPFDCNNLLSNTFTKINNIQTKDKKYIYPITLLNECFIVKCNYLINLEECEEIENSLGLNCLQKLKSEKLADISILF